MRVVLLLYDSTPPCPAVAHAPTLSPFTLFFVCVFVLRLHSQYNKMMSEIRCSCKLI